MIALLLAAAAAAPIGPTSGPRWRAMTGWVTNAPEQFSCTAEGDRLVFAARGAGTEIPFSLTLRDDEADGDSRYLVLRYRAEGLDTSPGNYVLHGWEGTPGGLTFAHGDEAVSDGGEQILVTDLAALRIAQPVTQVALKVRVGAGGTARIEVAGLAFVDALPAGAKVSRASASPTRSVRLDWAGTTAEAMTGWTPTPATDFAHQVEGDAAGFRCAGAGRGMRWRAALPEPVDLSATPYLSVRYRARGALAPTAYAIWLGDAASGSGRHSTLALTPGELRADGEWHLLTKRLTAEFTATHLAVGLDCAGEPAELSFGPVTFASREPDRPLSEFLSFRPRRAPPGAEFRLLAPASGGRPGDTLTRRLALADWFAETAIEVAGVPFEVPASTAGLRQTGCSDFGRLTVTVPPEATEIYLLTAAAAPASEPFGVDANRPRPIELMDQPEQVFAELRYAEEPTDHVLPIDVASGRWGVRRGIAVQAIRIPPFRGPRELVLHDRMQTASFAILAATARLDPPRVPEPVAAMAPERANSPGARLEDPRSALGCTGPELPFAVQIEGRTLPDDEWRRERGTERGREHEHRFHHPGLGLTATVRDRLNMRRLEATLELHNPGDRALRVTLLFPRVRLAEPGTWYLSGHRGGIIDRAPVRLRDPLGQQHPLQCDGFFWPGTGLALGCYTLDTVGRHHFIRLEQTATGSSWIIEYPDRDLPPGETFHATPARLELFDGGWRAIFDGYRDWLATWYQPPRPKPWFEQAAYMLDKFAHHDGGAAPRARGALQPSIDRGRAVLGGVDILHLFGCFASPTFGDWGDYGHYDETVGGLDYFRDETARAQADGVAVSLYLDGYLSSAKGEAVGAHAADWAMRRPDGSPWYVEAYDAYNQCPYLAGWQEHLAATYQRIARDLAPQVLYVDEFGATDGRWTCYATDHDHNSVEIPYAAEVAVLRRLRAAVGPDVALFSEYPPAEASRRYLDGSISYQALWSVDEQPLEPPFIDLPRFAFPAFRQFHILHYAPYRAGNWWPAKFPFFNGETYFVGEPGLPDQYDAAALEFFQRAIRLLREHRDAFASGRAWPLVPVGANGVFANRFDGPDKTVWTLYNSNGRTVRGPLLEVPRALGTQFDDAWTDQPVRVEFDGNVSRVWLELGPKAVGCVVATP